MTDLEANSELSAELPLEPAQQTDANVRWVSTLGIQLPWQPTSPVCDLSLLVHCWESQRRCPVIYKLELYVIHSIWIQFIHVSCSQSVWWVDLSTAIYPCALRLRKENVVFPLLVLQAPEPLVLWKTPTSASYSRKLYYIIRHSRVCYWFVCTTDSYESQSLSISAWVNGTCGNAATSWHGGVCGAYEGGIPLLPKHHGCVRVTCWGMSPTCDKTLSHAKEVFGGEQFVTAKSLSKVHS